jgi:hypothetical protein
MNIPIKKIGEINKDKSPKSVLELLQKQEFELNQQLFRLQQAYSIIHTYCEMIREGLSADETAIRAIRMNAIPIEVGSVNDFSGGGFYESYFTYQKHMDNNRISPSFPVGGLYDDFDSFLDSPGRPARYFSFVPDGRDSKKAGLYIVGYARGYYGRLGDAPQRILAYAKEQGYAFIGPVYEMYLHDEVSVSDYDQYLIQISISVKKRR